MELFDLKSTPVLNVQRFTSFEEFRPTDVTGAAQNCVVLDHKEVSVSRSILSLPAACLVLQRSFSRKFNVEMGGHCCAIVVPMTDQYYIEANSSQPHRGCPLARPDTCQRLRATAKHIRYDQSAIGHADERLG